MNTSKLALLDKLYLKLASDKGYQNIEAKRKGVVTGIPLVNQFSKNEFIPNVWFDWKYSIDASVIIIGQDWGPYIELNKIISRYKKHHQEESFSYDDFLLNTFHSRTENFILKALAETCPKANVSKKDFLKMFMFTVAVLFTRTGKHFRGNHNFDPKQSADHSYPYLKEQLDLVKPKVIITLGGLSLDQIERYFDMNLEGKNLTDKISKLEEGYVCVNDIVWIPNFHPAAHVSPRLQKEIWSVVWDFV